MRITIEIECESITDFYSHLTELRKQIKKKCKKENRNSHKDEFTTSKGLDDDNCYGTHEVSLENEDDDMRDGHYLSRKHGD